MTCSPRLLSSQTFALGAALVVLLTTITTCTEHRLKVIRRERFGEIENFYRDVRGQNEKSYAQPEEDITSGFKNIICLNILSSECFAQWKQEPLNMEERTDIAVLKKMDPSLAGALHATSGSELTRYANATVPIKVIVPRRVEPKDDTFLEHAFACPMWDKARNKVEGIYVSEEYKLEGDISARFLFVKRNGNKMVVMAVAQEAATVKKEFPEDFEFEYIQKRGEDGPKPAGNEIDDPICQHDTNRRLEICSSIFSSEYFDQKLIFQPNALNISDSCEKWRIGFRSTGASVPKDNEEWMLLCSVLVVDNKPPGVSVGNLEDGRSSEVQNEGPNQDGTANTIQHRQYFVARAYAGPGRALLFSLDHTQNRMYLEPLRISNVINIHE